MKPLFVLIISFLLALPVVNLKLGHYDLTTAGRFGMALMLAFTAIGHFIYTKGMIMMIPSFVPKRKLMVHLTGVLEFAAGFGLLIPSLQQMTGWCLIFFFLFLLPANIYASMNSINFEKGTHSGNGLKYLLFRIPLQALFMIWTYFSAIA